MSKKASLPVNERVIDINGNQEHVDAANQPASGENSDRIKVSKKLIASLKSNMHLSPNKAQRMQNLVERDDCYKLA